jgi:hypothetical protein
VSSLPPLDSLDPLVVAPVLDPEESLVPLEPLDPVDPVVVVGVPVSLIDPDVNRHAPNDASTSDPSR